MLGAAHEKHVPCRVLLARGTPVSKFLARCNESAAPRPSSESSTLLLTATLQSSTSDRFISKHSRADSVFFATRGFFRYLAFLGRLAFPRWLHWLRRLCTTRCKLGFFWFRRIGRQGDLIAFAFSRLWGCCFEVESSHGENNGDQKREGLVHSMFRFFCRIF